MSSITLADVAQKTDVLAVACSKCDRIGKYPLATLIERHGRSFSIPAVLNDMSIGCARRGIVSAYDMCGVHCPELAEFFLALESMQSCGVRYAANATASSPFAGRKPA
jgi:hypothetical protein